MALPTALPRRAVIAAPLHHLLDRGRDAGPGLLLALAVAAVATPLGHLVPVVGGPVLAIVLGVGVGAVVRPGARLRPGLAVASRPLLQVAIVLLGATLSLQQVATVGLGSLPVMLGTLAVALGGAWVLGRALGVRGHTQVLIGVGTGICGASAIAATTAVLRPRDHEVAYALGTIFVFNVVAVLAFPPLGHALGMDAQSFGLWAGTAVNDTSSVLAAAFSFGADAGPYATVVKLTRTLTLVPIVLVLAVWSARRSGGEQGERTALPWAKVVPWFLVAFVAASALDTLGAVPATWHGGITTAGTFLITTALAGIGLALRPGDLRRAGVRPLLLGAVLWVLVAASSLGLQGLTGTL
ncbi:putative integral membrane protein (TIGR00698 family) [Actinomycetospora succinea]|uniref:Putative integral membrane protein (TIGR00698 family) n=1 Tax=Actinomycetospora succinea TaxID=663603 RepID=A0A4R6USV3_9PSEU|nr:putative sulfate exporter family transporter [Actinomycetospora succinea]TDQ48899.1 putative integral membrane protein (TIGR00698 family) [Actinomycetospora succinea]